MKKYFACIPIVLALSFCRLQPKREEDLLCESDESAFLNFWPHLLSFHQDFYFPCIPSHLLTFEILGQKQNCVWLRFFEGTIITNMKNFFLGLTPERGQVYRAPLSTPCHQRPYRLEHTCSRLITKVKQRWAGSVLGRVTAWKQIVFFSFFCLLFLCVFFF